MFRLKEKMVNDFFVRDLGDNKYLFRYPFLIGNKEIIVETEDKSKLTKVALKAYLKYIEE